MMATEIKKVSNEDDNDADNCQQHFVKLHVKIVVPYWTSRSNRNTNTDTNRNTDTVLGNTNTDIRYYK